MGKGLLLTVLLVFNMLCITAVVLASQSAGNQSIMGNVELPRNDSYVNSTTNLVITGWAISKNKEPIKEVKIELGNRVFNAQYGLKRKDVQKAFPNQPDALNSGFQCVVKPGDFSEGIQRLSVKAVHGSGVVAPLATLKLYAIPSTVSAVIGAIDQPSAQRVDVSKQEEEVLSGWALDPNGITDIGIYIDGQKVGSAQYGIPRDDVKKQYPTINGADKSGFTYILNTSTLKGRWHVITLKVSSSNGSERILDARIIGSDPISWASYIFIFVLALLAFYFVGYIRRK